MRWEHNSDFGKPVLSRQIADDDLTRLNRSEEILCQSAAHATPRRNACGAAMASAARTAARSAQGHNLRQSTINSHNEPCAVSILAVNVAIRRDNGTERSAAEGSLFLLFTPTLKSMKTAFLAHRESLSSGVTFSVPFRPARLSCFPGLLFALFLCESLR